MLFRPALFTLALPLVVASSSFVSAASGESNPPDGGIVGGIDSGAIDSAESPELGVEVDAPAVSNLPLTADAPWGAEVVASADAFVAHDASVVADAPVAVVDGSVALDLVAGEGGGSRLADGGAGDAAPPPAYLLDGGERNLLENTSGCSLGGARPARGAALIPLLGLVALWAIRRRGRR